MPQEAEAGKRLARDMRRIREAHNLTVGDLHEETKIPLSLIQAFEETGLFDHPQFNRVYLRSFVRTYAHVVGVDADVALAALEDALAGRYEGSLAADYLGEERAQDPSAEAADQTAEDHSRAQRQEGLDEESTSTDPTQDADAQRRKRPPGKIDKGREPRIVSTTPEGASYDESAYDAESDKNWSAQSPPSGKRAAAGAAAVSSEARTSRGRSATHRRRSRNEGGLDRRWIIGGGMLIVVAVIVWILLSVLGDSEPRTAEQVAAADTVQTEDTTAAQQPASQPISLPSIGDTMNVYIVASQGPVDPIRVTVDEDLRRPYWIEQGDSMAFNPSNRIVVEELLDNIDLQVEGIEYPTDRRDPQGRIVITRDSLQNYFASLREAQ